MSDLRAQWDQASEDDTAASSSSTRWQNILQEFVELLNEHYGTFLRASLGNSSSPDVLYVRLNPRGQRNAAFTILTVHATETKARILGKDSLEFLHEGDLVKHLLKFKNSRSFKDALDELKEIANQPVDGVLRVSEAGWRAAVIADIKVEVPREASFALADASDAQDVESIRIQVLPATPTTFERGTYPSKPHPPKWLVAGGYVLEIQDHFIENDRICLIGLPIPVNQLERRR